MIEAGKARQLQAALRAYEAARLRLTNSSNEDTVIKAAEGYVIAKRRFKKAQEDVAGEVPEAD